MVLTVRKHGFGLGVKVWIVATAEQDEIERGF